MLDIGSVAPNFSMRVPLATCQCDRALDGPQPVEIAVSDAGHGIPTDKRRNHDAPTWWSSFRALHSLPNGELSCFFCIVFVSSSALRTDEDATTTSLINLVRPAQTEQGRPAYCATIGTGP
jgi:hypothetical protein